jgi:hypothetical protein
MKIFVKDTNATKIVLKYGLKKNIQSQRSKTMRIADMISEFAKVIDKTFIDE